MVRDHIRENLGVHLQVHPARVQRPDHHAAVCSRIRSGLGEFSRDLLRCKVGSNQRSIGPVKEARRHPVVLRQSKDAEEFVGWPAD
jgi:hypothetical protein